MITEETLKKMMIDEFVPGVLSTHLVGDEPTAFPFRYSYRLPVNHYEGFNLEKHH